MKYVILSHSVRFPQICPCEGTNSPQDRFPFANPKYRPGKAPVEDLLKFQQRMGIENVCLVAVSVYGHDNRSIFDAMRNLSSDSRAVVSFDPYTITEQELEKMHAAGVRGVRINLKTTAEAPSEEALAARLLAYAARIRSRQWAVQLYLGMEQVTLISHVIPHLGVKVVLDHMASPDPTRAAALQPDVRNFSIFYAEKQFVSRLAGPTGSPSYQISTILQET